MKKEHRQNLRLIVLIGLAIFFYFVMITSSISIPEVFLSFPLGFLTVYFVTGVPLLLAALISGILFRDKGGQ